MDMEWYGDGHTRTRDEEIEAIMAFVSEHRNSYASLAVCRRALDSGIEQIDGTVLQALKEALDQAPEDEVEAYYSIVR